MLWNRVKFRNGTHVHTGTCGCTTFVSTTLLVHTLRWQPVWGPSTYTWNIFVFLSLKFLEISRRETEAHFFFSSVFSVWGWFRLLTTSRSHTVKQKQRNQIKFFPRTIQSTRYTILQLRHYCPLSNSPTRSKGAFTSLAAAFIVATFVLIATIFLRNVENRHLVCLRCGCPRWKCPRQDLLRREVL